MPFWNLAIVGVETLYPPLLKRLRILKQVYDMIRTGKLYFCLKINLSPLVIVDLSSIFPKFCTHRRLITAQRYFVRLPARTGHRRDTHGQDKRDQKQERPFRFCTVFTLIQKIPLLKFISCTDRLMILLYHRNFFCISFLLQMIDSFDFFSCTFFD